MEAGGYAQIFNFYDDDGSGNNDESNVAIM